MPVAVAEAVLTPAALVAVVARVVAVLVLQYLAELDPAAQMEQIGRAHV
jgi:hypothetical protein